MSKISFFTWLAGKLGGAAIPISGTDINAYADEYAAAYGDVFVREMAFWSAANLMANAIAKCEFKTYAGNKEAKGREWYLWNVEPNKNQNSSAFLHKLVTQLYRHNECLVIESNDQLLIADSFTRTPYALYDDVFTQVTVGDFTFNRSFTQGEVLYFRLSECNMRKVMDGLYNSYSRLLSYSMNAYQKSRGTKGIFKYKSLPVAGTPQREAFDALVNAKIGKWLTGDNAALPLGEGQEWQELQHKTYTNESTRDIRAQVDDIFEFTAKCFGIPPVLLRGDVQGTSDAVDQLLTFGVDPLIYMIEEEINRKRSGYHGMNGGDYIKIDAKQIKHVDLLSVSTAIDKLIGSGAFCVNDIRLLVGEQAIDEPWAWQHVLTKNYMPFDEALKQGGDSNGD